MKNIMSLIFCLISLMAFSFSLLAAETISPFPAFVPELTIPNADVVDQEGKIFRGMTPGILAYELADNNFTDVLIFKRQSRNEVDEERAALLNLGFKPERIHHIAFNWKQYRSITFACEQTLEALRLLVKIKNSPDRKIYFHCTMGEDRTGHLAGLFRLLTEKKDLETLYQDELCTHGFAEGNKKKPVEIVNFVNGELKTLFLVLAEKIQKAQITETHIDPSVCRDLTTTYQSEDFQCR